MSNATQQREYIVGEVSKNWNGEAAASESLADAAEILCGLFERLIEVNRVRGYTLHSWKFNRVMTGPKVLNETIVAVFRLTVKAEGKHQ